MMIFSYEKHRFGLQTALSGLQPRIVRIRNCLATLRGGAQHNKNVCCAQPPKLFVCVSFVLAPTNTANHYLMVNSLGTTNIKLLFCIPVKAACF